MQPLEHKALFLSLLDKEDKDIPRVGVQAYPKPKPQPLLQPHTNTPFNNNSSTRNSLVPKKADKKRRARAPVKRRYKVRVIAQPLPTTPTVPVNSISAVPTPTVATSTATTETPMVKSAARSIRVNVYNLAQGRFEGISYPTGRPQVEENPSAPSCNEPPQRQQHEAVPNAPTFQLREDTPWPNTIPASTNLFKERANWPIPPTQILAVMMEKAEAPTRVAAIPVLWFCPNHRTIGQWKKNVHGDRIAPFVKRKKNKAQKIGMVTDKKMSSGTTTHKSSAVPNL